MKQRFRGFWVEEAWQRELDWIVDIAELWGEEDVALMLCYVSGRTIVLDDLEEVGTSDGIAEIDVMGEKADEGDDLEEEPDGESQYVSQFVESPRNPPPAPVQDSAPVAAAPPRAAAVATQVERPDILNQCIEYLASLSPKTGTGTRQCPPSWRK